MKSKKNGREPVRFTGQHFLKNPLIIEEMSNHAGINKSDIVLDIGAGKGAITSHLSKLADLVVAVEKDPRLVAALEKQLLNRENVHISEADFLKTKLPRKPYKVVSNIPYGITTALLGRLMDPPKTRFDGGTIIMELGAAKRITRSIQPDARIVGWNTRYDIQIIKRISNRVFSPPPKVTSAMVKICRRKHQTISRKHFYNYMAFVSSMLQLPKAETSIVLKKIFTRNQVRKIMTDSEIKAQTPVQALNILQWMHCFNTMLKLVPERMHPPMPGKYKKLYK